jgi:uncharacterized membrane protein
MNIRTTTKQNVIYCLSLYKQYNSDDDFNAHVESITGDTSRFTGICENNTYYSFDVVDVESYKNVKFKHLFLYDVINNIHIIIT